MNATPDFTGISTNEDHASLKSLLRLKCAKEFTRIQKADRKIKHCKRNNASGVSSNRFNIAHAMRVRMPKVPANLAPSELSTEKPTAFEPQNTTPNASINLATQITAAQPLIAAAPTSTYLQLPSSSFPIESLQQVLPKIAKRAKKQ